MSRVCLKVPGMLVLALSLTATSARAAAAQSAAAPASQDSQRRAEAVSSDLRRSSAQSVVVLPPDLDERRAEDIRTELRKTLERYPPALGRVLKLDPTLMANADYLAPYPTLKAFVQRHPEVARYPNYFLDFVSDSNYDWQQRQDPDLEIKRRAMDTWRELMTGALVLSGFIAAILTFSRLVKYLVGHRRWLRATKLQSDVNNRLLERFTSNDELMAYVQSPAGSQFLKGMPAVPDTAPAAELAAPFARILWSVQAGLVLASAGAGMLVIRRYVMEEVSQMILVMGVLAISLGIGFALAAAASYLLSDRLGLFARTAPGRRSDASGV